MPDAPNDSASLPSAGLTTFVEVKNTTMASGMRITPIVLKLALQVGGAALLDRLGDLLHLRRALVGGEHAPHQVEAGADGQEGREAREEEPELVSSRQGEVLVAPSAATTCNIAL